MKRESFEFDEALFGDEFYLSLVVKAFEWKIVKFFVLEVIGKVNCVLSS